MNAYMDLMPASCREWLGRRLRMKRWTIAYVATITVIVSSFFIVGIGRTSRDAELTRLSGELKQRWSRDEQIQQLLRSIKSVETTVTRYNRLAWPIRVTEAIDAVGAVTPDSVSLTNMHITPREETAKVPVKRTGPTSDPGAGPKVFLVIELEGVCRSDQDVAEMVAGLERNRIFAKVSLDYTRAQTVDLIEAREFRLTCEVDLSQRYAMASQSEGE